MFATPFRTAALLLTPLVLIACEGVGPPPLDGPPLVAVADDRGIDAAPLSTLEAGIYIDPDGCHIWMIDDGLEGYWSRRLDPVSGLPVCTPVAPPNAIIGDISTSPGIADFVPLRD